MQIQVGIHYRQLNIVWPSLLFGQYYLTLDFTIHFLKDRKVTVGCSLELILPSSASTQLKLRLRLALFPVDPATHPPGTVVSETNSRVFQDYFKTTLILVRHPSLNSTQLKLLSLALLSSSFFSDINEVFSLERLCTLALVLASNPLH